MSIEETIQLIVSFVVFVFTNLRRILFGLISHTQTQTRTRIQPPPNTHMQRTQLHKYTQSTVALTYICFQTQTYIVCVCCWAFL